ncbi:unnamed protein product [Didymodactylos carnosus]|uniref:Uncharacterized protein n=2 Tax=Didymodactylos carnosus TaxID=1234261 RepID=A0A815B0I8_9BILA|nr:unnamed protein product [Didymodactylos carnosus]CAF4042955.1 unnamed protein product [Didymodactylos carnosus]
MEYSRGQNQVGSPEDIAVDSELNVYVTDSSNNRLTEWSAPNYLQGENILGKSGGAGNGLEDLNHPLGLVVDKEDNLYLCDRDNLRVLKRTPGGNVSIFELTIVLVLLMDQNKERASDEQINLTTILTPFEYSMFDEYEKQCFTAEYLFFSMLLAISHFSQKSYFTHLVGNQQIGLNLYHICVGDSGSAKSQHISEIIRSAKATQKLFSSTYITTFPGGRNNGKREESSIVEELSVVGLLNYLQQGDKLLANAEIDAYFDKIGLYNQSSATATEGGSSLCLAFDWIRDFSRQTGSSTLSIKNAKLSLIGGTTGCKLALLLMKFIKLTGLEGYRFAQNEDDRPLLERENYNENDVYEYDQENKNQDDLLLNIVSMRESMSLTSPNSPLQRNEDEDGTNDKFSAYYYVFNATADEIDKIPYVHTRHYRDILAKAAVIYPKLCVNMQLFRNSMAVLEALEGEYQFQDGIKNSGTIPFEFIEKVKDKINEMFLAKAETNENGLKILYVTKDVCVGAKKYYKHLQNISFELFNINEGGPLKKSLILLESTKLKQNAFSYAIHPTVVDQVRPKIKKYGYKLLLKLQFNIFNKSMLNKNKILGDGPLRNVSPDVIDELLLDLSRRDLLVRGLDKWLQGQTGTYDSWMKAKLPPPGYERDLFKSHLLAYNIPIEEYNNVYIQSSLPDFYHLTDAAVLFFDTHLSYASEYHKYPLDLNNMITQKLNDGIIIFNTVTNSYEINQNGPNSESDELLVSSVAASAQLIDSWADQTSESTTLRRTPLQTISNLQSADQLDSLAIDTLF